jgi:hypothetical protein
MANAPSRRDVLIVLVSDMNGRVHRYPFASRFTRRGTGRLTSMSVQPLFPGLLANAFGSCPGVICQHPSDHGIDHRLSEAIAEREVGL